MNYNFQNDLEDEEPLLGVASSYLQVDFFVEKHKRVLNSSLYTQWNNEKSPVNTYTNYKGEKYGTDPNLITPITTWGMTLTEVEKRIVSSLSDLILPSTEDFPAPSEINISDFFDEWLSAPYSKQQRDRNMLLQGLEYLNNYSNQKYGIDYFDLKVNNQKTLLDEMIQSNDVGKEFFLRFRYLVIGGYFTSEAGMRELGYRGNLPLNRPREIPCNVLALVEKELKKLGL